MQAPDSPIPHNPALYPAALNLSGVLVLVVGGGGVAMRKITSLLAAGADITVVSPKVQPEISSFHQQGRLNWLAEGFEERHFTGQRLVFACSSDQSVNQLAARLATQAGAWVNVADDSAPSTLIVPATSKSGGVSISVNTTVPALSRKIREELDEQFLTGYDSLIQFLAAARQRLKQEVPDSPTRQRILHRFFEGVSSQTLAGLSLDDLHRRLEQCISSSSD